MRIIFILFSLLLAVQISACTDSLNGGNSNSDFNKLCKIYEEIAASNNSKNTKIVQLTNRIKNEIPNIYALYQNAALVDKKDKYEFYRQAAEKSSVKNWECKFMKSLFESESDDA